MYDENYSDPDRIYRRGFTAPPILLAVTLAVGFLVYDSRKNVKIKEAQKEILDTVQKIVTEKMEYAYMEGQRDAVSGDVRIEKSDSVWVYTKSPWDGKQVIPETSVPVEEFNDN